MSAAWMVTIGRDPSCDVVVDDPYASPRHAAVALVDGRCVVADLGSTNGTRVDRVKVPLGSTLPISEHQHIIVGRTPVVTGPLIERLRASVAPIRVEATVGEPLRPAGGV